MKNLRKVIFLFAFIFITGTIITVMSVNSSLNKSINTKETVDVQKDTVYLLQAEKKTV